MNDLRFLALSNAQIKRIKSLHRKEGRIEEGLFLVEGLKPVLELIHSGWPVLQIYATENQGDEISKLATMTSASLQFIPEAQMERISMLTSAPGILAIAATNFTPHDKLPGPVLVLDEIQDPGNLGTMIRTADWFGFSSIYVCPKTVEIFNPKVVSSAMGSLFRHKPIVAQKIETLDLLRKEGYKLYVSTLEGDTLPAQWPLKTAIVIGSESHGISTFWRENADFLVKIPSFGKAESLNAAIAFGIFAAAIRV